LVEKYAKAPDWAKQWRSMMKGELPAGWEDHLPKFEDAKPMATRVASGEVINALAPHLPMLMAARLIWASQTTPTSRAAATLRRALTTAALFTSACASMRWVRR
jgi:transketolase